MAPMLLLILGSAGLYVASRAAVDALSNHLRDPSKAGQPASRSRLPSPELTALGQWMPIAAVAGLAAVKGRSDIALGVIFGTIVATLSLALGLTTYMSPLGSVPPSRRAWPMLLAGAFVPLIAGFSGSLNFSNAIMLLLIGAAGLTLWKDRPAPTRTPLPAENVIAVPAPASPPNRHALMICCAQWIAAVAIAVVAAKAALLGTTLAETQSRLLQPALLSAAILSPMLILPALASASDLAHHGRSIDAVSSLIALAMFLLFALLPIVIVVWYARSLLTSSPSHPGDTLEKLVDLNPVQIPFPLHLWRVDAVLLAVLGLVLVPVSLGRIAIHRIESAGLVVIYAGYLAVNVLLARAWSF